MIRRRVLLPALLWLLVACGCAGPARVPDRAPETVQLFSDPALQAVAFPRFFGRADAPRTLILYTNPQCPPCKASWSAFAALLRELDPERLRVIVAGYGFGDEGTRLMFVAAGLAEQRPDLGVAFLSAVMEAGPAPYARGWAWVEDWLKRADVAGNWDEARFRRLIGSTETAGAYLAGVERIRREYDLRFTPTLVLDGRILSGPHTVENMLNALNLPAETR